MLTSMIKDNIDILMVSEPEAGLGLLQHPR